MLRSDQPNRDTNSGYRRRLRRVETGGVCAKGGVSEGGGAGGWDVAARGQSSKDEKSKGELFLLLSKKNQEEKEKIS
jgi:hypothetical protein